MTDYSKIFSSQPVNATAAKVISRSGIQWQPEKQLVRSWDVRSDAPIPTRQFTGPSECNLTGQVNGRLTVIGQARAINGNKKGAAWVVRCTCGYYEIRRTKAFKNINPSRAMCTHCDYFEEMKKGHTIPNHMKGAQ